MKVALVFDGLQYGGIERVGITYSKILSELGYKVDIYNLNPKANDLERSFQSVERVRSYNFPRKLCPEYYSHFTYKYRGGKYIYSFLSLILNIAVFLYKIIFKFKFCGSSHYDIAIAFSGHINDLTFISEKYVSANAYCCWLHGAEVEYGFMSSGFLVLYKRIRNLISVSNFADAECDRFNINNSINKLCIFNPCTILDKQIDEEKVKALKGKYGKFCLMVGRLASDKDQLTVIRAIVRIRDYYHRSINLLLVGDGPERSKLEKLVKEYNIQRNVIFCGSCADVQNYYKASYIYLHSAPIEGFGLVYAEAMSFGVPIITAESIPGSDEVVGNTGKYGFVVPKQDYKSMADKVIELYDDDKLYQKISETEKLHSQIFSEKYAKEKLKIFLESIINKRI